jgi:hypothetical protein
MRVVPNPYRYVSDPEPDPSPLKIGEVVTIGDYREFDIFTGATRLQRVVRDNGEVVDITGRFGVSLTPAEES